MEEARKHEEMAEQALARAKKIIRATKAALSIAGATRKWLEELNRQNANLGGDFVLRLLMF